MEEKNYLSNMEYSYKIKKNDELKPGNFKIDIRKVFSRKLKSKLINSNNSKSLRFIKPTTDNKNSQTILKNYDYDYNKIIKSKHLTESLNSISNLKRNSLNDALSFKIKSINNRFKENKTTKLLFKKSKSLRSFNLYDSLDFEEKKIKNFIINKYKTIKLGKKLQKKNSGIDSYKAYKSLEKIGSNNFHFSSMNNISNNTYNNFNKIDNISQYENKKEKIENIKSRFNIKSNGRYVNNYSSPDINIKNNDIIINKKRGFNKKSSLINNLLYINNKILKSNNDIILKNTWRNPKDKMKIKNWNNNFFNILISNINANIKQNMISKNADLSEDNNHSSQKVRISTLLNVFNNINSNNYRYK